MVIFDKIFAHFFVIFTHFRNFVLSQNYENDFRFLQKCAKRKYSFQPYVQDNPRRLHVPDGRPFVGYVSPNINLN
jgi:hypothetical protein